MGRHLSRLLQPVVRWAVSKGLGFGQVARLLKPLFLREAQAALHQEGRAASDSALALVAGLHRADIHQIQAQWQSHSADALPEVITVCQQVLANWVVFGLPPSIPFKNTLPPTAGAADCVRSFSDIVHRTPKAVSNGFSPRLVLRDMARQGLVVEVKGQVVLQPFGAEGPDSAGQEQALEHLSGACRDLIAAGLHNLQAPAHDRFLEQSLDVDGLRPKSVQAFQTQVETLWQHMLTDLVPQAQTLSDHDEPLGGQNRLRLGIYFYAESPPKDGRSQGQ